MAGRPTEEIADEFVQDTHSLNTHELAEKYERALSTIREWRLWARANGYIVGTGKSPNILYVDRKNTTRLSDEGVFRAMADMTKIMEDDRPEQCELTIEIKDDLPIGIVYPGDLHMGVEGVDYETMERDFRAIGEAEGVYAIGMGDYAHNPKINMGSVSSNLYRMIMPDCEAQYRAARFVLSHIERWIGLITGCHDDWDFQVSGNRRIEELCEYLDTANLWHGAVIHLTLGLRTYDILARHKYKFESNLNVTNAHRNAFEQLYPADVIAFAHKHTPAMEKRPRWGGRKDIVNVRGGSYYRWDDFGQKIGGYEGIAGIPLTILYPNEKKVLPFYGRDLDVALRTLKNERSRA